WIQWGFVQGEVRWGLCEWNTMCTVDTANWWRGNWWDCLSRASVICWQEISLCGLGARKSHRNRLQKHGATRDVVSEDHSQRTYVDFNQDSSCCVSMETETRRTLAGVRL